MTGGRVASSWGWEGVLDEGREGEEGGGGAGLGSEGGEEVEGGEGVEGEVAACGTGRSGVKSAGRLRRQGGPERQRSALSSLMTPSWSIDFLANASWRETKVAEGGAATRNNVSSRARAERERERGAYCCWWKRLRGQRRGASPCRCRG